MVPGSLNSRDMTDPVPGESGAGIWMFLKEPVVPVRTIRMFYFFIFNEIFMNNDDNSDL
jgi:hypothetical protein